MSARLLIDGDACPVREEAYRVARRHKVPVTVVANQWLRTPADVAFQRVDDGFDAADDWIAAAAGPDAVVVTADILLADRCLKEGAAVISPAGEVFTADSIGSKIATRAIMSDLRDQLASKGDEAGHRGGPAPFSPRDRSRFLQALHLALEKRAHRG